MAAALIVPFVAALWLAGVSAAVGLGMGFLAGTRPAISLGPRSAMALAVPIALTGAVAVGLRGQPFTAACFVALCCLMVAPAELRQQGLLAGVPTAAALLVSVPGTTTRPRPPAGWSSGSLLLVAVAVVAKFPRLAATGTPPEQRPARCGDGRRGRARGLPRRALPGAARLWVAVTITVVLRPLPDETGRGPASGSWHHCRHAARLGAGVAAAGLGVAIALVACLLVHDLVRAAGRLRPPGGVPDPGGGAAGTCRQDRPDRRGARLATLAGTLLAGVLALFLDRTSREAPETTPPKD
ncbi:MAG: hypothetical protein R2719_00765 [Micropruina sp.]